MRILRFHVIAFLGVASAAAAALPGEAAAAESSGATTAEVEALRAEVRQLRGELSALRIVLANLAELDRQRASLISRALEGSIGDVSEAVAPSLDARSERAEEGAKEQPSAKEAPARRPSRKVPGQKPTGTISGKVAVPSGEPVAYVYVENVQVPLPRPERVTIEQRGKAFAPPWAVIRQGTTVEFPNRDNIYHNVFSRSPGNAFDLGLYNSSDAGKSRVFTRPGAVEIYCNIHPQMAASLLVVPSGHFAKVTPGGEFKISGVPVGSRKVAAWAPGSHLTSQWVDVSADGNTDVTFTLQPKGSAHTNKDGRPYGSYP